MYVDSGADLLNFLKKAILPLQVNAGVNAVDKRQDLVEGDAKASFRNGFLAVDRA